MVKKKKSKKMTKSTKIKTPIKVEKLNLVLIAAIALVVISAILYNMPFESEVSYTTTTTVLGTTTTTVQTTTTTTPTAKGTVIIAFKDEDQSLPGGAIVKGMDFAVTGVEVLASAGEDDRNSDEWIKIFEGEKTLDLLKYTTTFAEIAEKEIDTGRYDKIKIMLSDGTVSIVHTVVGIYKPKIYDLEVQEETTVDHEFEIVEDETLTLVLDFDVRYSVKRIGVGYLMTPIIVVSEQTGRAENMAKV